MEITTYPDPVLRRTAAKVEAFGPPLVDLARSMLEQMYRSRGGGLAAPQGGLSLRLIVFNPSGEPDQPEQEFLLANPRLLAREGEEAGEEGCLSLPGLYAEVRRPTRVRYQAQDLEGREVEGVLEGFPARVLQHEMDHLEGILLIDRVEPAMKLSLRKTLERLEEEFRQSRAPHR